MDRQQEAEIIARVKAGDTNAFGELVEASQDMVYGLAYRMTHNRDDAFEQSQNAYLQAFQGIGSFEGGCSFSTWIYTICRNMCIDFLRRKKKLVFSMTRETDDAEDPVYDVPDAAPSPEESALRAETRREIRAALDKLSDEHREVFLMREIDGLTYAEISETLGIELGTVKSRIARARMAIRNELVTKGNKPDSVSSKTTERR